MFDVNKEEAQVQGPTQPQPKEPPAVKKEEAPAIVSKWSLVDYENEDDDLVARWHLLPTQIVWSHKQ